VNFFETKLGIDFSGEIRTQVCNKIRQGFVTLHGEHKETNELEVKDS
jgi:hypothetical protein